MHSRIIESARHYSQRQLTVILGEPQPRISDLLNGKIAKFSLEKLVSYADALQMRPQIRTRRRVVTFGRSGNRELAIAH